MPESSARTESAKLSLFNDSRGAILVGGIFMAMFLTAMLGYVASVGQATFYREQLQDASDGTALSAAITMARGMNFMVFINLIMEALVMVILVLNILVTALGAVALILTALWMFPAAAFVAGLAVEVHEIAEEAQNVIFEILPILHEANGVVRVATPFVAEAESIATAMKDYKRHLDFAFMVPTRFSLPMESSTYSRLCGRAGYDLTRFILELVPLPKVVKKVGASVMRSVTSALSAWFCGDGSGEANTEPPTVDRDYSHDYPETDESSNCELSRRESRDDDWCKIYSDLLVGRTPPTSGLCSDAPDAPDCKAQSAKARTGCDPHAHSTATDYRYSEADIRKVYVFHAGIWTEDVSQRQVTGSQMYGEAPVVGTFDAADADSDEAVNNVDNHVKLGNPCEKYWQHAERGTPAREPWNTDPAVDPQDSDYERLLEPVCSEPEPALPQLAGPGAPIEGQREPRKVHAVMQVFGCSEPRTEKHKVMDWNSQGEGGGEGGGGLGDDDKAPYIVEADKFLGDEDFQVRVLAIGHPQRGIGAALKAARWGKQTTEPEPLLSALDVLTRISVAEAEFFYNGGSGSGVREEWSWNMKWSARLVQFRLPGTDRTPPANETATVAQADPRADIDQTGSLELSSVNLNPNIPTSLGGSANLGGSGIAASRVGKAAGQFNLGVDGTLNDDGSFSGSVTGAGQGSIDPTDFEAAGQQALAQGQQQLQQTGQNAINKAQQRATDTVQQGVNRVQQRVDQVQGKINQVQNKVDAAQRRIDQGKQLVDKAEKFLDQGVPSLQDAAAFQNMADQFDLTKFGEKAIYDLLKDKFNPSDLCIGHGGTAEACQAALDAVDSIGALIAH